MTSSVRLGAMITGVIGLFTLAGFQHMQLKTLEARLAALESGGERSTQSAGRVDGIRRPQAESTVRGGSAVSGAAQSLGERRSDRPNGFDEVSTANEAITDESNDAIAQVVAKVLERRRGQSNARGRHLFEQHLIELGNWIVQEKGLEQSVSSSLADLVLAYHDDRRYLEVALMDGSLTLAEQREELRASKEEMEREMVQLIGADGAAMFREKITVYSF